MNSISIKLADNRINPECLQEILDLIGNEYNDEIKEILDEYEVKYHNE